MTDKQLQRICRNLIDIYKEYGVNYTRSGDDATCEALYTIVCGTCPDQFDQNNDKDINHLIDLVMTKLNGISITIENLRSEISKLDDLYSSIENVSREIIAECWFTFHEQYLNIDKDLNARNVAIPRICLTEEQVKFCEYVHLEKIYDKILWSESPQDEDDNEHVGECDD